MVCLTWNLEWAAGNSPRGRKIKEKITSIDPDVACFTEVTESLVPAGHAIRSDSDYGYKNGGDRRKVILWSRSPWSEVDTMGSDSLPSGRFASGVTNGIRFVGVCIPWRDAHTTTGRRNRKPWEDHLQYLAGLTAILTRYCEEPIPICLVGDYNQRIPRITQPVAVAEAMKAAIPGSFTIATAGLKDLEGDPLVDHFACSPGLTIAITTIIAKVSPDGVSLSDHPGVVASILGNR